MSDASHTDHTDHAAAQFAGLDTPVFAPNPDMSSRDLAILAARAVDDKKASDTLVIEVGPILAVVEYFVITSAANRRLVRALADEVEGQIRLATGRSPLRVEGAREQQWVLIDYGDIAIHVFSDETRSFYEIERLYRDAPFVAWAEPPAPE